MQRYELVEGASSKFWEAGTEGATLKVRFGRIGTPGQAKDKALPSADAAQKELDKLVREKTGKGYRLVADNGGAAAPQDTAGSSDAPVRSARAKPAKAKSPSAEAPPVVTPPADPLPEISTSPHTATRPAREGGPIFVGTPLPTRTRPGPSVDASAEWTAFVRGLRALLPGAPGEGRAAAQWLSLQLDDAPPAALDAARAGEWVDRLLAACPGMDQRAWGIKPPANGAECRACFTHFARWLVAGSGAVTLVAIFDRLRPRPTSQWGTMPTSMWEIPTSLGVRAALVGAADYEGALEECLQNRAAQHDEDLARFLTFVLADDRPDATHDLRAEKVLRRFAKPNPGYGNSRALTPMIAELPPSRGAWWQAETYHKAELAMCDVTAAEAAATVIAVARGAGEAATPSLAWLLRDAVGADRTMIAKALLETREDGAFDALLPFVGSKLVRDALDAAENAFPIWVFQQSLAATGPKAEAAYGPRIAAAIDKHGEETVRAWARESGPPATTRLDRVLAARNVPLAPTEAWPGVLRDPPWRRKGKAPQARIELNLAPIPTPFSFAFDAAEALDTDTYQYRSGTIVPNMSELARAIAQAETVERYGMQIPPLAEPRPGLKDPPDKVLAWLRRRIDVGRDGFTGFYYFNYGDLLQGVAWQPEPLALMLWEMTDVLLAPFMIWRVVIGAMVARFDERAVPGLEKLLAAEPAEMLPHVADIDAAEIAPIAARALRRTKKARPAAIVWLVTHFRTAAMRLLPDALGPAGAERDAAESALRALVADDPKARAVLDAAIDEYTAIEPRVREAVAAGLDSDPLEHVPAKVSKPPAWAVPSALSRPMLHDGRALPDEAVATLIEMLSFCSPLNPYAGLKVIRDACTPESLDAFALDLFQAWLSAGANQASEWAMQAMGWLGADGCARDLTRQIRVWGNAGLKPRGKAGIEVLANIGTDLALMNLSALAEKNPLKQLRETAGAAIAAIAESRSLSEAELADRLSPDLGLDERGGLDLSFGERRFRVGFDETLRPWVRDAAGQRLTLLPRPNKTDDQALAKAAATRWTGLKKDAEATAGLQISRLETMLTTSRRVAPGVFWPFFATHPLIRHLAGRLVWGLFADAMPGTAPNLVFRITEDLSLTDAGDEPLDVDIAGAAGHIGLVHPLQLNPDASKRWVTLFADYEIAQPFSQLARETFALDARDAASAEIARFAGAKVAGRRLRGLRSQGWTTDGNGETVSFVQRRVVLPDGTGLSAMLGFADGFWHSQSREGDGIQTLETLTLTDEGGWGASRTRRFGDLDPVTASEVLRTPSLLAATGAT